MKILVLGSYRYTNDALIDMSHQLTMIALLPTAATVDVSSGYHALHFLPVDADVTDIMALVINLHRLNPFDAVVTFHETFQAITVDLCQALTLKPIYQKQGKIILFTDYENNALTMLFE